MRLLVISDIHANWEACDACWRAAAGAFDQCLCLGDIVGYGASPNECVEWLRPRMAAAIRGNHDRACVDPREAEGFNSLALTAALWTHDALQSGSREWLATLPVGPLYRDGLQLVHGSPRDEDEYVLLPEQAQAALAATPHRLTFLGHTHLQGGFAAPNGVAQALESEAAREFPAEGGVGSVRRLILRPGWRYLINPGSVGQPRDGDWRAAFVIYDTQAEQLTLHRLPYDLRRAQERILAAGLPPALAERLARGR